VIPRTLADIPTPALVVDSHALDRNIARMADFFAAGPCRLRPHFKAHKTPEIARRQLAAGSCTGLTCATVGEAEVVAGLCPEVLIANEIVSPAKCQRVAALARRMRVIVAVDSLVGLGMLSRAAESAGARIGVLIDVNVGQNRCGVEPGQPALTLARHAVNSRGILLRGVMGYEGHLQPVRDVLDREARAQAAMRTLVDTAELIRASGLACDIVSAGGTGTYDISGRVAGVTEIQAGSYVLMDTDYAGVGVPFEAAFRVLGTVVSRPARDRCIADCGHKAASKDHGFPAVLGIKSALVTALNDEHATIAIPESSPIAVGDQIALLPSHTDPTVNLHDVFFVVEGETVVDLWPIVSRGYPEHRALLASPSRA
jgi:D-serine deaminase-like pyridoxal phosphate-dependent protein